MKLTFLVSILWAVVSTALGEAPQCDCSDWDANLDSVGVSSDERICGEDGLMYETPCTALCQGVKPAPASTCTDFPFLGSANRNGKGEVDRGKSTGTGPRELSEAGFRYLGELRGGSRIPPSLKTNLKRWPRRFGGKSSRPPNLNFNVDLDSNLGVGAYGGADLAWAEDRYLYARFSNVSRSVPSRNYINGYTVRDSDVADYLQRKKRRLSQSEGVAYLQVFGDNGKDDRGRVWNTTLDPFRKIGYVEPAGCTGTLIGPRHVLTSAHCVFDTDTNEFDKGIRFTPAMDGDLKPFGWIKSDHVLVTSCFVEAGSRGCDFAVVVLKESIGRVTGWFGLGMDCDQNSVYLETAGYPIDKQQGTMWYEGCGTSEAMCWPDPGLIQHDCDVNDGMSGAALWDGASHIRAIHRGYIVRHNVAVNLTPFVFNTLQGWMGGGQVPNELNSNTNRG